MPKSTLFSIKNRKNRPSLGAVFTITYASGGWGLRPWQKEKRRNKIN